MERYNVFPAAHIMGNPADGYSSGQALEAMERAANAVLPNDFSLGWVGSALQEKLASADTTIIFVLALVMVFLILAAQYESWSLPLAVLTAVPSACSARWSRWWPSRDCSAASARTLQTRRLWRELCCSSRFPAR